MMYAVVSVESGFIEFMGVDREQAASRLNIEVSYFNNQCVLCEVSLEKLMKWGDELLEEVSAE